jgi:glucose uptake protein
MQQADDRNILSAMLGGAVWNIGTLLLTAGIAVAGMSVAFPIGGGIGWILGIVINYVARPAGDPILLFGGSLIIIGAIVLSMIAYRRLARKQENFP